MINFAGAKRLYAKGTCNVILSDVSTGDIKYQSNKFNTGSITSSISMNEIRAGLGNPIAAIIPSDSGLAIEFSAADFDLWEKAAQVGGTLTYNAVVPTCQTVTATGSSLAISVTNATPVAQVGYSDVFCYVQEVGAASALGTDGAAYKLDPASGAITGFNATAQKKYKVWYFVQKASARMATISSMFDPQVVHFTAQIAVYANESASANEGTRVGWLYVIVPYMKMQGKADITADQGNNDTTNISGQAIAYDDAVVSAVCSDCESSKLAYYIYAPDDSSSEIAGLAVIGGVVSVTEGDAKQIPVRFVMEDGSTIAPSSYSDGFTYTASSAPSGTTVSDSGVVNAGSTAGEFDVAIAYSKDGVTASAQVAVEVVSA